MVDRIASGDFIGNRECIGTGILYTQRIPSYQRSRWNPTIQLKNAAQLPIAQHHCRGSVERCVPRHLPNGVDRSAMSDVEIRYSTADLWREPEPACDRIREGIARDGCGTVVHRFAVGVRTSE